MIDARIELPLVIVVVLGTIPRGEIAWPFLGTLYSISYNLILSHFHNPVDQGQLQSITEDRGSCRDR